ncbi:MAG: folate-binding protein [Pseudomonadota bacterium]
MTAARRVLSIGGADRRDFLQNLVTNDIGQIDDGPVYAALLTPQGKYLADFFLTDGGDMIYLDVAEAVADDLARRLAMYRLRADVTITPTDLCVNTGLGPAPDGAAPDPRHPALGWRAISERAVADPTDRVALRVAHLVPETGIELIPNETYPLEAGFERLNGVDFRKGCYVGQEVTARMKHKTELKKGLAFVCIDGPAEPGEEISRDGKIVGTLLTRSDDHAIAYLRFDRAGPGMQAGDTTVTYDPDFSVA